MGLPASSEVDIITAKDNKDKNADWGICEMPSGSSRRSTLKERRKPAVVLEELPDALSCAISKAESVLVTGSQVLSDDEKDYGTEKTGPVIVSNVHIPRELRIRIMGGDIVNSPLTVIVYG